MFKTEQETFKHYISTALDVEEIAATVTNYIKYFGPLTIEQLKIVDSRLLILEELTKKDSLV